jgi:hypothetical protein
MSMPENSDIILFQTENWETKLEVRLENETVCLSQSQMAKLFQRERSVITKHINNVFDENEFDEKSYVQYLHIPKSDKAVKYFGNWIEKQIQIIGVE